MQNFDYKNKYLKYKNKYIYLKKGGAINANNDINWNIIDSYVKYLEEKSNLFINKLEEELKIKLTEEQTIFLTKKKNMILYNNFDLNFIQVMLNHDNLLGFLNNYKLTNEYIQNNNNIIIEIEKIKKCFNNNDTNTNLIKIAQNNNIYFWYMLNIHTSSDSNILNIKNTDFFIKLFDNIDIIDNLFNINFKNILNFDQIKNNIFLRNGIIKYEKYKIFTNIEINTIFSTIIKYIIDKINTCITFQIKLNYNINFNKSLIEKIETLILNITIIKNLDMLNNIKDNLNNIQKKNDGIQDEELESYVNELIIDLFTILSKYYQYLNKNKK